MNAVCVYFIYEAGNFLPALQLCAALKRYEGIRPILYSPYYLPETERYVRESKVQGVPYIYEVTALGGHADWSAQLESYGFVSEGFHQTSNNNNKLMPGSFRRTLARIASILFPRQLKEIRQWDSHYKSHIKIAGTVLDTLGAQILIFPEDNVERDTSTWCIAVHERGGKAYVVSYGSVTPDEAAIAYWGNPDYVATTLAQKLFLCIFPWWGRRYQGRRMLRLPLARALSMERCGLAPGNPWVVNTGDIDCIVVESRFMQDLYSRHGIPMEKLHPLGHVAFDVMADAASNSDQILAAWCTKYGVDRTKPVVLCALPPNQYPGMTASGFGSYMELINGWLSVLREFKDRCSAVLSPHPSMTRTQLADIQSTEFPVLEGTVARWIPVCNIYIACVSTTIKWARACGKPVINFDCYGYHHNDYYGRDGIETVYKLSGYRDRLAEYLSYQESGYRNSVTCSEREYWGIIDGSSVTRIVRLLSGHSLGYDARL